MVTQTLDQNRGSVWIWLPCVADLFQFCCAAVPVNHCSRQTDTVIILIILHRFPVSLQWRLAGIRSILLLSGTRGPDRRQLWQVEPTFVHDNWPDCDLSLISLCVLIHLHAAFHSTKSLLGQLEPSPGMQRVDLHELYIAHLSKWYDVILVLITGLTGTADAAGPPQLSPPLRFPVPYVPRTSRLTEEHRVQQ